MSDDRFDVIVHHGGEVEAHEEAAEVEIGDASGLNSDVEVGGEIEVETMPESDDSSRGKFENRARHYLMMNGIQKNHLVGQIARVKQLGMKKTMMKGQDVVHSRHL